MSSHWISIRVIFLGKIQIKQGLIVAKLFISTNFSNFNPNLATKLCAHSELMHSNGTFPPFHRLPTASTLHQLWFVYKLLLLFDWPLFVGWSKATGPWLVHCVDLFSRALSSSPLGQLCISPAFGPLNLEIEFTWSLKSGKVNSDTHEQIGKIDW